MLIHLFKKSIYKLLVISLGLLLITTPFIWLQLSHPQQFSTIAHIVAQSSTLFTVFRWVMIALFIGGWPYFIRQIAKNKKWHKEKTMVWLSKRFRVSAWLIIFELLVCENLLLTLIKWF